MVTDTPIGVFINTVSNKHPVFDINCRQCPRLANFLDQVKAKHPTYFCRPVPNFGDPVARFIIVGLAPGMHGANRTGRPFTGDYAGILLYETLYKYGFATKPVSESAEDELQLVNCRISNAVKCLPPDNKPLPIEIATCNQYLTAELTQLAGKHILLALGNVAHVAVLKVFGLRLKDYPFGHGARHALPNGFVLYNSYHCSRYNTQTRRLTEAMFHEVFVAIQYELKTL